MKRIVLLVMLVVSLSVCAGAGLAAGEELILPSSERDANLRIEVKNVTAKDILVCTFDAQQVTRSGIYTIGYDPQTAIMMTYLKGPVASTNLNASGNPMVGENIQLYVVSDPDSRKMMEALTKYIEIKTPAMGTAFLDTFKNGTDRFHWERKYSQQDAQQAASDLLAFLMKETAFGGRDYVDKGMVFSFAAPHAGPAVQVVRQFFSDKVAILELKKNHLVAMNFTSKALGWEETSHVPFAQLINEIKKGATKENWDRHEMVAETVLKFRDPAVQAALSVAFKQIDEERIQARANQKIAEQQAAEEQKAKASAAAVAAANQKQKQIAAFHASPWKYVTTSVTNVISQIKPISIETVGDNIKRAQYRDNYALFPGGIDNNFRIVTCVVDFDCKRPRSKMLSCVGTMQSWEESSAKVVQTPVFEEIPLGSVHAALRDAVCTEDFQGNKSDADTIYALMNAETARLSALAVADQQKKATREQNELDEIRAFEYKMRGQSQSNYNKMNNGYYK
jgi:hypothetical protein